MSRPPLEPLQNRPKRADARRNYDKVVAAARDAFAERGTSTSLEEISRRPVGDDLHLFGRIARGDLK